MHTHIHNGYRNSSLCSCDSLLTRSALSTSFVACSDLQRHMAQSFTCSSEGLHQPEVFLLDKENGNDAHCRPMSCSLSVHTECLNNVTLESFIFEKIYFRILHGENTTVDIWSQSGF